MNQVFRVLRIITVPPVFAAACLLTVYFMRPDTFVSVWQLLYGLFFLGALPVLGYPLQKLIPYFRERGREGQRSLAMIFSVCGYLLGLIAAFVTQAPLTLCLIYLEYLLCGIAMLIFNRGFHLRASGHACGIAAPVLLLAYFKLHWPAAIGALLIIPVFVSSVKTKRHTVQHLVGGCLIAVVCLLPARLLCLM